MKKHVFSFALAFCFMLAFAGNAKATFVLPTNGTNGYLVPQSECGYALGEAYEIVYNGTGWAVTRDSAIGNTYDGTTDGYDDMMIAFHNTSATAIASVDIMGYGNGGGIFAVDGDDFEYTPNSGITSYTNVRTVNGYTQAGGTVNFTGGLTAGETSYMIFESAPLSIINPVTGQPGDPTATATPVPASLLLLGSGLLSLAGFKKKIKK